MIDRFSTMHCPRGTKLYRIHSSRLVRFNPVARSMDTLTTAGGSQERAVCIHGARAVVGRSGEKKRRETWCPISNRSYPLMMGAMMEQPLDIMPHLDKFQLQLQLPLRTFAPVLPVKPPPPTLHLPQFSKPKVGSLRVQRLDCFVSPCGSREVDEVLALLTESVEDYT